MMNALSFSAFLRVLVTVSLLAVSLSAGWAQRAPVVHLLPSMTEEHGRAMAERFVLEADSTLELRAVGLVGGEPVAMIDVNGHPVMAQVGVSLAGWDVRAITVADGEVVLSHIRENAARTLRVTDLRNVEFPEVSAAWIDQLLARRHRSMPVARGEHLPPEVIQAWPKINREGKEEILLNYLRMGWAVGCIVLAGDRVGDVYHASLWETRRRGLVTEKRQVFLTSLEEAQRTVFTAVAAMPAVDLRNPPSPEEMEKMRAWAKSIELKRQEVVDAFSPEQRALYDEWMGMMGQPSDR